MKILLTGAQGFLGGRVLDFLLENNYEVAAITRRPAPELLARGVEVIRADLRDRPSLDAAIGKIDGVINCAARSGFWGNLNDFIQDNTLSALNLINAARQAGARWFVHTSSPSVVHTGVPLNGIDESVPYTTCPNNAYSYSKMLAERLVLAANEPGFQTAALRPHLIWGPGDPHFLPRLRNKAAAGRLWLLKSEALVDGTYIDNAAWAHVLAAQKMMTAGAEKIGGQVYFIAQGEPLTAANLIGKILEAISTKKHPLKIQGFLPPWLGWAGGSALENLWRFLKIKNEPPLTRFVAEELTLPHWFNLEKAKTELGYQPVVSMAEGLKKLGQAARL